MTPTQLHELDVSIAKEGCMSELKRCPFCGSNAELDARRAYRELVTGTIKNSVAVYCVACAAEVSLCQTDVPQLNVEEIKAILIGNWNSRRE